MKQPRLLWQLFSVFFRVGLFTFGGGYAMISIIEDACVDRRGWITKEEMDDLVVVAESTPGPIAINCATYVGSRQAGLAGAIVATLGMILPSFLVIFAISRFLDRFLEIRAVASAFQGVKLAVSVLIFDAGLRMLRRMPKKPLPIVIFSATLVLMLLVNFGALRLSSIVLMLAAAAVSLAVCAVRRKRGGEEK